MRAVESRTYLLAKGLIALDEQLARLRLEPIGHAEGVPQHQHLRSHPANTTREHRMTWLSQGSARCKRMRGATRVRRAHLGQITCEDMRDAL